MKKLPKIGMLTLIAITLTLISTIALSVGGMLRAGLLVWCALGKCGNPKLYSLSNKKVKSSP